MSQPLLFVNPDDNQIYKVQESVPVTLEMIDAAIAHHQNKISDLNVERIKFVELQAELDAANSTDASAPDAGAADTPETPAPTAPAADVSAPADNTAAPAATDASPSEQPATPPIAA